MIKDEEGVGNYKLEHFYYIVMSEMAMRLAKLMCTMYLQGHDMERSTRTSLDMFYSVLSKVGQHVDGGQEQFKSVISGSRGESETGQSGRFIPVVNLF